MLVVSRALRGFVRLVMLSAASAGVLAADNASFAPFTSAETCRTCHAEIYAQWRESWMSRSWSNPVFQKEFAQWRAATAASGKEDFSCMDCHAPAAVFSNDWQATSEVTGEGVTCDICHRIAQIDPDVGVYRATFDPRPDVKYSSKASVVQSPHSVQAVDAVARSQLCAACHWQTTAEGEPLERTFEEWRSSTYATDGTTCIDCHMRSSGSGGKAAHGHRFPGSRSNSPMLPKAARLAVIDGGTTGREFGVTVENAAVGHHFPTGGAHPTQLTLSVTAYAGSDPKPILSEQRIYETPLSAQVHRRPAADSTLKPRETRRERFTLPRAYSHLRIEAVLTYQFLPDSLRRTLEANVARSYYAPVVIDRVSFKR